MQVKKFEAPTIQEALETIKRELGPEAIILQTKKNKRGFGLMSKASVEITAAVSDRSLQKKQVTETRLPVPSKTAIAKMSAQKQADMYDKYMDRHLAQAVSTRERVEISASRNAAPQAKTPAQSSAVATQAPSKRITATRYIDIEDDRAYVSAAPVAKPQAPESVPIPALTMELEQLKQMIDQVASSSKGWESGALQDAFEQLVLSGVDKRYAYTLVKEANFELGEKDSKDSELVLDQIATQMMEHTRVVRPELERLPQGPRVIALVGPTGVGKTTTIAKIASDALSKKNLKVGLINVDSHKMAAFDQLGTYAKILGVPFRSANTAEDLRAAVMDFSSLDLVLIDTTGRSQKDPEALQEAQRMLDGVTGLQAHLVLSATTRDTELYEMASKFSLFKPQGIVISKLDEATSYGSIYNVCQKAKIPLSYFTTGQKVPDDLEEASPERVAALVLEI